MKIIITLRDNDTEGKKINLTKDKNEIINFCKEYFNCEEIEVLK